MFNGQYTCRDCKYYNSIFHDEFECGDGHWYYEVSCDEGEDPEVFAHCDKFELE